ncbi:echinoidin-like, partial [Diadema antillarum]|uniref:echinoidin-like n=1 Tax=Diadema antillarum TaxID=105358 RepID=UPI003A854125
MVRSLVILAWILGTALLLVDAGSICPTYWTEFGGHCYRHFSRQGTWREAETHCQSYALPSAGDCSTYTIAHLASILSQEEQDFVYTFFDTNANAETDARLWIGFNNVYEDGGNFEWSDGTISFPPYTNWRGPYPDDADDDSCALIPLGSHYQSAWDAVACSTNTVRHFICEGPA